MGAGKDREEGSAKGDRVSKKNSAKKLPAVEGR